MSQRSSSAKKLQEHVAKPIDEEDKESGRKSLLSNKDYDEIRSIVRQKSVKGALSSKKSESVISI